MPTMDDRTTARSLYYLTPPIKTEGAMGRATSTQAFIKAAHEGKILLADASNAISFIGNRSVLEKLDTSTIDKYYSTLKVFLTHTTSLDKEVKDLDEIDALTLIDRFQTIMGDVKPWGEETRRGRWYIFKRYYEFATENGGNPRAAKIISKYAYKVDTKKVGRKEAFNYEEQLQLIDAATTLKHRTLLALFFRGGFRSGEISTLQIRDVNIENGIATIQVHNSKTVARPVFLVDYSAQFLARYIANHAHWYNQEALLFTNDKEKPLNKNYLGHLIKRIAAVAGIHKPKICPHILRHSAATEDANYMTKAELDTKYGWTSLSNTAGHYTHKSGIRSKEAELRAFKARQERHDAVNLPDDRY